MSLLSSAGRALVVLPLLLWAPAAQALRAPERWEDLGEADREALERVAREPEAVRELVLEAALRPEVLVEMQLLQARSSAAFQQRIETLSREDQEAVWEIARVPGLLAELAGPEARSRAGRERIADAQPQELREDVLRLARERRDLLVALHAIGEDAEADFEALLSDLPEDARGPYRELVEHPELLTLLATHVRLSVEIGNAFRADPDATRGRLAALAEEVARSDAEAEAAWEESLAGDADAVADLEGAAQAYADEEGLDYDGLTSAQVETSVHVVLHPYPYWFGFPSWYVHFDLYPWGVWYPFPVHFGFYYHPYHHHAVFFGLPSLHFVHWYRHKWPHHLAHRHFLHHDAFASHLDRHPRFRRLQHLRPHHAGKHAVRALHVERKRDSVFLRHAVRDHQRGRRRDWQGKGPAWRTRAQGLRSSAERGRSAPGVRARGGPASGERAVRQRPGRREARAQSRRGLEVRSETGGRRGIRGQSSQGLEVRREAGKRGGIHAQRRRGLEVGSEAGGRRGIRAQSSRGLEVRREAGKRPQIRTQTSRGREVRAGAVGRRGPGAAQRGPRPPGQRRGGSRRF